MRDMRMILNQWGAWVCVGKSPLDWPSVAAGFKGLLPRNRRIRSPCCDDDGRVLDAAVLRLKQHDPYLFQLIVLHYIKGIALRSMSEPLGISHNEVTKRIQVAEGFIEGVLAVSGAALEIHKGVQKEGVKAVA
ncbi:antiterminator Q family protein [Xenorhabdus innexi]|uniref:Antitermination protein n=1 Tax=Xenorhabdus innexi TaxID=290109 RepID=A0A1N6MU30_9GAMM|nr:antiterminator Q family protein [Xenorhabdus innexi]PHM33562.1 antitermination protein [Xenorhabdus innexi]SIP72373.1 putative antitermination protein Q [Xenorhabdus innexi]